tara:strand:- start:131 stop:571 length:441 start_codon:yes stop_codon:yes gene_type:complete
MLNKKIEDLEMTMRVLNCLKQENIDTVEDLVKKTKGEMLRIPNFGYCSLNEVTSILEDMNLKLNMSDEDISKHEPPATVEENGNSGTIKNDLNYDILKVAKEAFIKSHRRIIYKTDWTPEEVKDFFNDHQSVLNTYRQSLNELFYN